MKTRISKITFKDTGHVLRIYDFKSQAQSKVKECHRFFDLDVASLHETFAEDMNGYVLIAWDKNGAWDCSLNPGKYGHNLMPALTEEIVRRRLTADDIRQVDDEEEPDGSA